MSQVAKITWREDIESALRIEVQAAAERIGQPDSWAGLDLCFAKRESYALAISNVLERLAERFEISIESLGLNQLDGALGEFIERTMPGHRSLRSRGLNDLVLEVRRWRVRMFDEYELLPYPQLNEFQKRLRKLERQEKADRDAQDLHWRESSKVRRELDALWSLNHQLLTDKAWWNRRCELEDLAEEIGRQYLPQSVVPLLIA